MENKMEEQFKILLITSADCSYVGADSVGQGHMSYPANTLVMKTVAPTVLPEHFYLYCFNWIFDIKWVLPSAEAKFFKKIGRVRDNRKLR